MKVTIKFYSGFEKYLKNRINKILDLPLIRKENIITIIRQFLPEEAIGFVGIVLVNKKIVDFDYEVVKGDNIEVFFVIGGG